MSDETHVELTADELRARADGLEQQLREAIDTRQELLVQAELKLEAVRAGMVDLDGLKLLDSSGLQLGPNGEVEGAQSLMQKLRAKQAVAVWTGVVFESWGAATGAGPGIEIGDRG